MDKTGRFPNPLTERSRRNVVGKTLTCLLELRKFTFQQKIVWQIEALPLALLCRSDIRIPVFMTTWEKCQKFALYQHQHQLYNINKATAHPASSHLPYC